MLSPNDISPNGRAASIWSFDSGYGSNTLEDDDHCKVFYDDASPTCSTFSPTSPQPVGLGLGGFWNAHIEDQLRITRSVSPFEPEPLQLSVFTATPDIRTDFILPALSPSPDECVTCQLWGITNPGENLKCDDCCKKDTIAPQSLDPKSKFTVPRLDIPQEQQSPITRHRKIRAARCSACELSTIIDPVQSSSCPSCNPDPSLLSPVSPIRSPKVTRSCAKRPAKLPAHALRCLHTWLRDNRSNPYPDAETKRALAEAGRITERQVNTWFTNARARRLSSAFDASIQSDDEGNDESGIVSISSTPVFNLGTPFVSSTPSEPRGAAASPLAATSHNASLAASRRGKKKDYGRMKAVSPIDDQISPVLGPNTAPQEKESETWQCTFCGLHIAPKSWRRHEDTQHRPQKRTWTCLLHGPRLTMPSRSNTSTVCALCMAENPSDEHFRKSHRIAECLQKCEAERTFLRPDHLRQHVKNFHKTNLYDAVRDSWRRDGASKDDVENWTCGFCSQTLRTWDMRETHIAGHFKEGLTMAEWKEEVRILPGPAIEATKRRRNSTEDFSNMFTKLTRPFTGRSTRSIDQRNHHHNNRFANAFAPLPLLPPPLQLTTLSAPGPSVSLSIPVSAPVTPLLPDMVFDSFMAEVCGNLVDTFHPAAPISPVQQYPSQNPGTMASFCEEVADVDVDVDLDSLTSAFLNTGSMEFQEGWGQGRQE